MKTKMMLLAIVGMVLFVSCNRGPDCEELGCENGGTCTEAGCECPEDWSGPLCETLVCEEQGCQNGGTCTANGCNCLVFNYGPACEYRSADRFTGTWSFTDDCSTSNEQVVILENGPTQLQIEGLYGHQTTLFAEFEEPGRISLFTSPGSTPQVSGDIEWKSDNLLRSNIQVGNWNVCDGWFSR